MSVGNRAGVPPVWFTHRMDTAGRTTTRHVLVPGVSAHAHGYGIPVTKVWPGEAYPLGATYDGVRLHPVLLARALWDGVPDEGAKSLPARLVPCDDLRPPGDVDSAIPAGS